MSTIAELACDENNTTRFPGNYTPIQYFGHNEIFRENYRGNASKCGDEMSNNCTIEGFADGMKLMDQGLVGGQAIFNIHGFTFVFMGIYYASANVQYWNGTLNGTLSDNIGTVIAQHSTFVGLANMSNNNLVWYNIGLNSKGFNNGPPNNNVFYGGPQRDRNGPRNELGMFIGSQDGDRLGIAIYAIKENLPTFKVGLFDLTYIGTFIGYTGNYTWDKSNKILQFGGQNVNTNTNTNSESAGFDTLDYTLGKTEFEMLPGNIIGLRAPNGYAAGTSEFYYSDPTATFFATNGQVDTSGSTVSNNFGMYIGLGTVNACYIISGKYTNYDKGNICLTYLASLGSSQEDVDSAGELFGSLAGSYFEKYSVNDTIGINGMDITHFIMNGCAQYGTCQIKIQQNCANYNKTDTERQLAQVNEQLKTNPTSTELKAKQKQLTTQLQWCGCMYPLEDYGPFVTTMDDGRTLLPVKCTPVCNASGVGLFAGNPLKPNNCTQSVCVINDVNIKLDQSSGGPISFQQNCVGNSGDNAKAMCFIDNVTVDGIQSTFGKLAVSQNCTTCYTRGSDGIVNPIPCSSYDPIRPDIRVNILPTFAVLTVTEPTVQLTADVYGTDNKSVVWSLSPNVGSISTTGLYRVPDAITNQMNVFATATSVEDPTVSNKIPITLMPITPGLKITVSPLTADLTSGQTLVLSALVINSDNDNVSWVASAGTIVAGRDNNYHPIATFTAPSSILSDGIAVIKATSVADSSKFAVVTVNLKAPPITPITPIKPIKPVNPIDPINPVKPVTPTPLPTDSDTIAKAWKSGKLSAVWKLLTTSKGLVGNMATTLIGTLVLVLIVSLLVMFLAKVWLGIVLFLVGIIILGIYLYSIRNTTMVKYEAYTPVNSNRILYPKHKGKYVSADKMFIPKQKSGVTFADLPRTDQELVLQRKGMLNGIRYLNPWEIKHYRND